MDRPDPAWDERDLKLLLSIFHPDMVWPWPPDRHAHDPMTWVMPWGRFDEESWRARWGELFRTHELVHNRRVTREIGVTELAGLAVAHFVRKGLASFRRGCDGATYWGV